MRKANFCFEHNWKKEGLANWKAKKNNSQPKFKKNEFVPHRNFKNNKTKIILTTRISREIGMVLPTIRIILRAKKLQIIMKILPRVLNVKSLLSAGNVMAHTMPRSIQTEKRLSPIFILYKRR